MRPSSRFLGLVWVCLFLSGCSYQQFALPDNPEPPEAVGGSLPVVKVRQQVQITTGDGSKYKGEVVFVSPEKIRIGKPGNFGYEETEFSAADIAEIQAEKAHGAITGVAMGLALAFALLVGLASQVEWPSS